MSRATAVPEIHEVATGANDNARPVAISPRGLLVIYSLIPAAALVIIIDWLFLNSTLKRTFPHSPYDWWTVTALVSFPHIFASQFGFVDREYAAHYSRLLLGIPLVALSGLLLARYNAVFGNFVFQFVTIYHVIFQQIGISRMMLGQVTGSFTAWKWLFFGAFTFAHLGHTLHAKFLILAIPVGLALIPTTYLAYRIYRESKSRMGGHYLWANQAMLLFVAVSYPLGYPVFSILLPRLVHDASAFVFYIAHDHNRNYDSIKNGLYRLLSALRLPVTVAGPVLAFGANLLLISVSKLYFNPFFYAPVTMIHYYTERVVWRRNTPHRQAIFFSK